MADAPQVAFDQGTPIAHQEQKQVFTTAGVQPYWNGAHDLPPLTPSPLERPPSRTIFGLRRQNFWTLFAIILVIAGATIGGSVGGVLAVKNIPKYIFPIPTTDQHIN
jgi:hypothetical protein